MHVFGAQEKKGKENGGGKNIWKNNDWKFPQTGMGHQFTYSRSSVNSPQNKSKDNNAWVHHRKSAGKKKNRPKILKQSAF